MIQLKCYEHPFNTPAEREATKQTWIDLYETEPIKLTLSIEDITTADATSTFSKSFKVPGTRNNAEFFKNSFDVDDIMFDVTIKKPAEILVDGAEFKQGHVRLQRVYLNTELDRYDYELIFLGETRDFSSKIGDRGLCQLQLNDLIGGDEPGSSLTADDIIQSWQAYPEGLSLASGLHNGNIIFPLIDHGNTYDDAGDAEQTRISIDGSNRFTQNAHPLTIDRFKPMIRAKRIWDRIFEDAGYTYTSNFLTSELFHQIYVSAFGNTATVGWDSTVSSTSSDNVAFAAGDPSEYNYIGPIYLPSSVVDPGNNISDATFIMINSSYDGQTYTYYEVPEPGEYQITGECYYTGQQDNSDYQPTPIFVTLQLVGFPPGGGPPTVWATSSAGFNETLQFSTTLTTGQTSTDIYGDPSTFDIGTRLFMVLGDIFGEYIDSLYTTDFQFQVVAAPGKYNPVSSLECTYKQIDFIKDILTAFRLVLSPDPNNIQNFIVEPWQNYINSGDLYDWSKKLVEDKEVIIEPVFYNQSAEIDFKFQPGGDYANIYHQQAYSEPYGYLQFDANNDLLIGKREIKLTGIAPTILLNIEGTTPADNFNIPQMHTHSSEDVGLEHLPIKAKTRLLFYNGLQPVNTHVWYFQGATQEARDTYPLVSPYQEWPIQSQTLNLNWANDVQYWGTASGLNNNGSTLYSNYWSRYISFLYGKYSRRVTAYFILNNVDLNTFSFDDTIFVNGTYYRPEKIIDVEIGAYTQVKVQLLTANDYKPPIIPFQELLEVTAVGAAAPCAFGTSSINVTTNGTPGFTWQLSNGMTGSAINDAIPGNAPYNFTIENVPTGIYTLLITDNVGRTKTVTGVIVPPSDASPVTATATITNASQCDLCDGQIQVIPSGGTAPLGNYTIDWGDGPTTDFTRTDLCVGEYSYTVYDSLGCAAQSYVVQVLCPGTIHSFAKFTPNDCSNLIQPFELRYVFYPEPTSPSGGKAYTLSDLSGNPIDGCWNPMTIVEEEADSLVVVEHFSCQECFGTALNKWLLRNCETLEEVSVYEELPGMTVGSVWELVGRPGCWEAIGITFLEVNDTLAIGPYLNCVECTGVGNLNYEIERCDGTAFSIAQFPYGTPSGEVYYMSDGFCYTTLGTTNEAALLTVTNGPYGTCITCEEANQPDICVTNFGASMAPCIGGTVDDYMEGYVDLSDITPVEAQFTLRVYYIPGTTSGNCNNVQDEIDLNVIVEAGEQYGLLTCPQAPFIDFNGATICSVEFVFGDYPLCAVPDPNLCTAWIIENNGPASIEWSGLVCGTQVQTGGTIDGFESIITTCIIDGTLEYTGAPTVSINAIC